MKTPWTRSEKWLWAMPLLFGVITVAVVWGPGAFRRTRGWPQQLATTPNNQLTSVVLSRNGSVLAATGYGVSPSSGTVYLWDARTMRPLKPFAPQLFKGGRGRGWAGVSLALSPDGTLIGIGNRGAPGYAVYEVATQNLLWRTPTGPFYAQFSSDGRFIALGGLDLREALTGNPVSGWKPSNGSHAAHFSFSPDAKTIACIRTRPKPRATSKSSNFDTAKALGGGGVEIRRVSDGQILRVLPNSQESATVAFSPDGRQIVSLAQGELTASAVDGSLVRCHSTTGKLLWQRDFRRSTFKKADYRIFCDAVFSPDGQTIALREAMLDSRVLLLNSRDGSDHKQLEPANKQNTNFLIPCALAFSPDGKQLFARGRNAVIVWDVE